MVIETSRMVDENMSEFEKAFHEAEHPSDKWNLYLDVYEHHLSKYFPLLGKFRAINDKSSVIIEVGVQNGGSLSMLSKIFPMATIYGIDIDPKCADLKYENPRVEVIIGDQGDSKFWDSFITDKLNGRTIDIFIDDGGHFVDPQILTFQKIWPHMSPISTYICEDTHTSYMAYNGGGLNRKGTFIEYAKKFADVLHYDFKEETTSELEVMKALVGNTLQSVTFYNSMVVFEKNIMKKMERISNV